MSQQPPGKRAGKVLMLLAWGAGLFLATRYFGEWEQRQENPNAVVTSQHGNGYIEVQLVGNRQGHFVSTGKINGRTVQFLLDTGATDVAIPGKVADILQLPRRAVGGEYRQRAYRRLSNFAGTPADRRYRPAQCARPGGARAGRRASAAGHERYETT